MASCAVCLQPIVRGQRFLLDRTEVFHATCVGQSYRSQMRLAEQRAEELERQLADTRRAAARVELDVNRLRNEAMTAQSRVIVLEGQLAGEQTRRQLEVERGVARGDELRVARTEIATLRAELATLKTAEEPVDQDVDATVQRFRMLELD